MHVTLEVREPSTVDLTVAERVQLDRLVPSAGGLVAERRGELLRPGVTSVALEPGRYMLKTLSDAHLKVVCGGVAARVGADDKDPWPDPGITVVPKGDDPPGDVPTLTIK